MYNLDGWMVTTRANANPLPPTRLKCPPANMFLLTFFFTVVFIVGLYVCISTCGCRIPRDCGLRLRHNTALVVNHLP